MHKKQDKLPFAGWTPEKRLGEAQKRTNKLVDDITNLIFTHQNVKNLVLSPTVAQHIPRSYAAIAYSSLQHDIVGFEVIRLCAAWDGRGPRDTSDKASIPVVKDLISDPDVIELWRGEVVSRWSNMGTPNLNMIEDQEMRKDCAEQFKLNIITEQAPKSLLVLIKAVQCADKIMTSDRLKIAKRYRDIHLAHSILKNTDPDAPRVRYGDLRGLLLPTIKIIWCLYCALNGTDMDFKQTMKIARRNSADLWNGARFNIPDR